MPMEMRLQGWERYGLGDRVKQRQEFLKANDFGVGIVRFVVQCNGEYLNAEGSAADETGNLHWKSGF